MSTIETDEKGFIKSSKGLRHYPCSDPSHLSCGRPPASESIWIYPTSYRVADPEPMTREQILDQVQLIRNFIIAGRAQDPKMILQTIEPWLEGLK